ncbi:hypothetical protein ACQPZQ_33960 [Pseudonocardia sp. CA-142604]|uniref:hypothetical protein n=1 Tax=Pseudonocardia sp. CA-142604 TaxID=3240024 RepID=UPI003D8D7D38
MTQTTHRAIRALAAAAVLALTTIVIPVAIATPASATEAQCVDYLRREGVMIGPKVRNACDQGASSSFVERQACFPLLVRAGVSDGKASDACSYAYP